MCDEDGAQREVYKLKEEHEGGDRIEKREKKKYRQKRERRTQEGKERVVLVTKEKRSLDRL